MKIKVFQPYLVDKEAFLLQFRSAAAAYTLLQQLIHLLQQLIHLLQQLIHSLQQLIHLLQQIICASAGIIPNSV
jgi:thiaminase